MTTEAASREAGIPLRYLRMLEEGKFPTVADPAYLTYFLRRYARFLGLDPEASARDFLNETEPETTGRRAGAIPSAPSSPKRRVRSGWSIPPGWTAYGLYGLVLVAGVTGLFAFVRAQQEREARDQDLAVTSRPLQAAPSRPRGVPEPAGKSSTKAPPAPAASGGMVAREVPAAAAEKRSAEATRDENRDAEAGARPADEEEAPVAIAGRQPPDDGGEAAATTTAEAPAVTAEAPAAAAEAPAAASSPSEHVAQPATEEPLVAEAMPRENNAGKEVMRGPFELRLTATSRQVWVWVSVDGGPREAVSLKRGETAVFHADRRYVLSIDDAGGIEGLLNGEPLPRFGASARARRNLVIPSVEFGGFQESSRG